MVRVNFRLILRVLEISGLILLAIWNIEKFNFQKRITKGVIFKNIFNY